jgi:multidrug efflux system outer membrane protein
MNESNRMTLLKLTTLAGATALLAACATAQAPYQRPDAALPAHWGMATNAATTVASSGAIATSAATTPLDWADWVTDPELKALVTRALANNRDARVAALQVEQLRAQYRIREAARLPTVNAGITGSRQAVGSSSSGSSAYTAGLQVAGWEMDFFGRLASLQGAALAQFLASEEAYKSTQLSLVAAVVSGWLNVQGSASLLALTRDTLVNRQDALRLVQLRLDNGLATSLDLSTAQTLVESAQVTLAQQTRDHILALNALALLVGQSPDQPLNVSTQDAGWEAALQSVPVGLPSAVLLARPDIRAAEQTLLAAHAQVDAARAAFFPRIALTASVGTASSALSGLFAGGSWGLSLAPQALLPIFDGGANQAGLESARAGRELALAKYDKAIQSAFREVNDALAGRETLARQLQAQQAWTVAETERLRLSELRLKQGVSSQLDVLDAQRSLFAVQQALVQTRFALLQNRVELFRVTAGV